MTDSQLKAEVAAYNELIEEIAAARQNIAELEAQRERKLGRIEILSQIAQEEGDDE